MPAPTMSKTLFDLYQLQRRDSERQRSQHQLDIAKADQHWNQQAQWEKARHETAMKSLRSQHDADNKNRQQRERLNESNLRQRQRAEREAKQSQLKAEREAQRRRNQSQAAIVGVHARMGHYVSGAGVIGLMKLKRSQPGGPTDWERLTKSSQQFLLRAAAKGVNAGQLGALHEKYLKKEERRTQAKRQQELRNQSAGHDFQTEKLKIAHEARQARDAKAQEASIEAEKSRHRSRARMNKNAREADDRTLEKQHRAADQALQEQHEQKRFDVHRNEQEAANQKKSLAQRGQERRFHLTQGGFALASGNLGGAAGSFASAALGAGPATVIVGSLAAVTAGAQKTANALEIMQNSTLSAGQQADRLAKEFIPGAAAFIALRNALGGLNEALRQNKINYTYQSQAIQAASSIKSREFANAAELSLPEHRVAALGEVGLDLLRAPTPGAILPRGTFAQEIAFQNQQRILPHRYALARNAAEKKAAEKAFKDSGNRVALAEAQQATAIQTRDARMTLLQARKNAPQENMAEWHKAVDTAATSAALAILEVDKARERVTEELNRQRKLGLTIVEKELANKKISLNMDRAVIDNLKGKEQRSASMAGKIGSMMPYQQQQTLMWLRLAEKHGMKYLPQIGKQAVESFMPGFAQKFYEKEAPQTQLYKEAARIGGKDFIEAHGDFAGLRREIQEKSANFEVKVIFNEEAAAAKIVEQLGPILNKLLDEVKIRAENEKKKIEQGMTQTQAAQH